VRMERTLESPSWPQNAAVQIDMMAARVVLFVGAHPDDVEFYCGATVARLLSEGTLVYFLVATMGGRGKTGAAGQRLRETRRLHQRDAARILGGAKVTMFDYPDKSLREHVDEFGNEAGTFIRDLAPDYVVSWDPDRIVNPHPDHRAAARAIAALDLDNTLFYGTRAPNLWIASSTEHFRLKLRALRAHRTETPWYYWWIQRWKIHRNMSRYGKGAGTKYAEAFRNPTQTQSPGG
jgi:LmbE family N-acetylglucosaminyl deacetylase